MKLSKFFGYSLAAGLSLAAPSALHADTNYPNNTIRFVVPFAAGNNSDILARFVADHMSKSLKVPVIVDNKPGGDAMIGAAEVANAAPDGYTVLLYSNTACCVAPVLHSAPYDPLKSFAPITQLVTSNYLMVTASGAPYDSAQALIDAAKASPGKLTYASDALGSALLGAEFIKAAGIEMRHIPYKGSAAATNDVANGDVTMLFTGVGSSAALVEAGRLKAIGNTSLGEMPAAPGVPPVATALPGFEFNSFMGIAAPAGTPEPVIEKLNTAILAALDDETVWSKIAIQGHSKPELRSPAEFSALIESQVTDWKASIEAAGLAKK